MNDLLSSDHVIEMATSSNSKSITTLDKFFQEVDSIQQDFNDLKRLKRSLKSAHEHSKVLHSSKAVKDLRSRMDADGSLALNKAKTIKTRLEALDQSNAANRRVPGCGPGSSLDRTRTSVVNGMRIKMKEYMDSFNELRQRISREYREIVQRRYFAVTGENPDDKTTDLLISTGESERFLQKAIQQEGKEMILDIISEIQERHDAVIEIEKNLNELHQVFLDMSVLIQAQGDDLNDIESHMMRACSYVEHGNKQLHKAEKLQLDTRKQAACCIFTLLLIIVVLVFIILEVNLSLSSK